MTGTVAGIEIFEELRYVWELLAAEYILLIPFAKAKQKAPQRIAVSIVVMTCCSQFYFQILRSTAEYPVFLNRMIVLVWYMFLFLMSAVLARYCFELTFTDALYMGITGYSTQHMMYVVVHEVLAKGFFQELNEHLWLYAGFSLCVCAFWYTIVYLWFRRRVSLCEGVILENNWKGIGNQLLILLILMVSTFTCQHIFEESDQVRYHGAIADIFLCMLILFYQYEVLIIAQEAREKAILAQIQSGSRHYYNISKELIETINRKSHDLKHALRALAYAGEEERRAFIKEAERDVEAYQRIVKTEHEALNTILAEKSMYCENRHIQLKCVINEAEIDFISVQDLYVLLGNAVDNAIECVEHLTDGKKRVITLNIGSSGAFISIQTANYYTGSLKMEGGLPMTSKKERLYHGFGLKSIRHIARKYGGDISIDTENGIFTLQIVIPVPQNTKTQ